MNYQEQSNKQRRLDYPFHQSMDFDGSILPALSNFLPLYHHRSIRVSSQFPMGTSRSYFRNSFNYFPILLFSSFLLSLTTEIGHPSAYFFIYQIIPVHFNFCLSLISNSSQIHFRSFSTLCHTLPSSFQL